MVGRAPLVLDYEISANAVYSDGKPITCDDMVLAWAAQSGRFPGFDAASRAGYSDIASVDCAPGQKKARVSFAAGPRVRRLRPAVRGDVDDAVARHRRRTRPRRGGRHHRTADQRRPGGRPHRAGVEHHLGSVKPDLDLKRFPSSGPYKLDSVTEDGAVVLVANDKWWGAKPITNKITVWPRGADIQDRVNQGAFDVVDIATGSSGTLNLPDDYVRTDTPSAGIEQLIFAPQGPLAAPPARRALALCTPRDVIARNAEVPIANARLNPATEDAIRRGRRSPSRPASSAVANPAAARAAINNQPLTVRIGYQSPNARLAATVGAIAKACAPAGITVQDAASETAGPLALRNNEIDVLIASTGGAAGSGSTGSSAMDAYDLHTGNGNNLPGYSNERIDGIIAALAVTSDPKELARLLGEGGPVLWADMPTLPLYRQQRTLLTSKKMYRGEQQSDAMGRGVEHGPLGRCDQ